MLAQLQSTLRRHATFARSSCIDFLWRHGEGGGNHPAAHHDHDHGSNDHRRAESTDLLRPLEEEVVVLEEGLLRLLTGDH